jgi:uncharacterized coiled-coil DUF342 family protein
MSDRDVYIEKAKSQLTKWNADFDMLEAKVKVADAEARNEYQKEIDALKAKSNEFSQKLDELKNSSDDAWQDLVSGLDTAWQSLADSIKSAADRFK